MTDDEETEHGPDSELWRRMLERTSEDMRSVGRVWRMLPSPPRCKICAAPFEGFGGVITRITRHRPAPGNPLLCNYCFGTLVKNPGGAEVAVSVLFADIRGSTALAERIGAAQFSRLLRSYYAMAAQAIEYSDGIVHQFYGDGVMALFLPVIAGKSYRLRAIEAGRRLIGSVENSRLPAEGVRIGVGIAAGKAFVGVVGNGERLDFSAVGDLVNTAARLSGQAGPAELFVAAQTWHAAGLSTDGLNVRELGLTGRKEPIDTVLLTQMEVASDESFQPRVESAATIES